MCAYYLMTSAVLLTSLMALVMGSCNGPFVHPPHLLVKYGDPARANCTTDQLTMMGWESPVQGIDGAFRTELVWRVESLTDWRLVKGIQCYILSDAYGQCLESVSITIYKPPTRVSIFVADASERPEGQSVQLECLVEDVAPLSSLKVTWFKGQEQLTLPTYVTFKGNQNENVTMTQTLQLTAGKEDLGGPYRCEAKLEIEGLQPHPVKSSDSIGIFAPVNNCPSKAQLPENSRLPDCIAEGNLSTKVAWFKGHQQVDPLSILSREDGGRYTIIAKNSLGAVNQTVDIDILFGPEMTCSMKAHVKENERLPSCIAMGNPVPEVTWFKGQQQVDVQTPLSRMNRGQYTVYARNSVGVVNQTVDIDVLYGPEIICLQKLEVRENEALKGCTVNGNPTPEVTWYKGDPKSRPAFHKFDPTSKLGQMDGGSYTVFAESEHASVQHTVEVVIISKGGNISMSGGCVLLMLLLSHIFH